MTPRPLVLAIAGSDPGGGAGVQADLRTFAAMGVVGVSVVTALTVQNSHGVESVHSVEPAVVAAQLETILADARPQAVKIGMLGGAAQVRVVADILRRAGQANIVLDPVLASTNGVPLLDEAGRALLVSNLAPLCALVTPNQDEWRALGNFGAVPTLVKGGHLPGDPVDILLTPDGETRFPGPRVDTPHTHGTGCLLSSAIAAFLARGLALPESVEAAKELVTLSLQNPTVAGSGRGYPDAQAATANISSLLDTLPLWREPTHAERLAKLRGLYVLTDTALPPGRSAEGVTVAALAGGARVVQLRDKTLSTLRLIALARRLRALTRAADALLIINDRVDVALASDADGVHLGPDDMHPRDARSLLGPSRLVGISVSTPQEASGLAEHASYFGVGAIFGTSTKLDAGPAVGLARIGEVRAAFPSLLLVAIGGIGLDTIQSVAEAGADAAAVVSAVTQAPDMKAAVQQLIARFEQGQASA